LNDFERVKYLQFREVAEARGLGMKERTVSLLSLGVLVSFGIVALLMSWFGPSSSWKFPLAFYPLFVVLLGVAFLRQSGLTMALVGLTITVVLAVFQFGTPPEVALGASVYGFLKSFGISISVAATMLMIYLMKEANALQTVSKVIKQQVAGNEVQALYIGIGFGSFLSSLGVVTPALFPPLLVAMGFTPAASIAIAVLGYDPTTSFSLLSIPITLPAQVGGLNAIELAFKVAIFLPLVSTGFAFAVLWVAGGKESMRKGMVPAVVSGLTLAFACLAAVSIDFFTGVEYVPIRIVGVIGGLAAMLSLHAYQKLRSTETARASVADYPTRKEIWRSFSPWIILAVLATAVSIQPVGDWFSTVLGDAEKITIFTGQTVDLDVFSQIYTWIFVAILLSLLTLRPTRTQALNAFKVWLRRFPGPFLAFALYFCIAFVMSSSPMNVVLGETLAAVFGVGYIFVAASLGLFGAIVGGSETTSNVLFLGIQRTACKNVGLNDAGFMTVYGSHAVAGGIASAVTPAKINNAVVTIDESHATESLIMRKHLIVAVLLTVATGVLTGIFVNVGI
jgi:lactate permease